MSEIEDKLGAILGNPQMMQQIMAMAQAMNSNPPPPELPPKEACPSPGLDPAMLQSLANIAKNSGADQNQQTLLKALCPYLSEPRVNKLEKAMRAAKMAKLAGSFLNSGGLQLLTGR